MKARTHLFWRIAGASFGLAVAVAMLSAANSIFAGGGLPTGGSDGNCLQWLTGAPQNATWSSCGSGNLPSSVQGDTYFASGVNTPATLAKSTSATRYISNTGTSNNPAWAQVDLSNGVTNRLPFANLVQGAALTVVANATNATADFAALASSVDGDVLRHNGTVLAWGTLGSSSIAANAITLAKLATQSNLTILSNVSGGAAVPSANTITQVLDNMIGSTSGNLASRGASTWGVLPGTSGGVLYANGTNTWATSGALTLNTPVLGGGAGGSPTSGTVLGTTTQFVTFTGSTPSTNDCAKFDINHNLVTAGAACGGAGSSPGGANTQVQFNDSGNFGGNAGLVFDKTAHTLVATGTITGAGFNNAYVTKTANYPLTATDGVVECLTNAFNVTLPTAVGISGRMYTVKNLQTANTCTMNTTSSQTIDGSLTVGVANGALTVISDGSNWRSIAAGGIPVNAIAQGDLLYGSAANVLSTLAKDTNSTRYLANTGTSNNPAWAQIALTTGVTGTLPIANGGTNNTTATDDTLLVGNGTSFDLKTVPNCIDSGGNHLNYTQSTNAFSCGTSGGGGGGGPTYTTLSSDFSVSVTSAGDVTGLSQVVSANDVVKFDCTLMITAASGANTQFISLNGPASPTSMAYGGYAASSNSQSPLSFNATTYDSGSTVAVASTLATGTPVMAVVSGTVFNGANSGTVILRAWNNSAGTSTVWKGSFCTWKVN